MSKRAVAQEPLHRYLHGLDEVTYIAPRLFTRMHGLDMWYAVVFPTVSAQENRS